VPLKVFPSILSESKMQQKRGPRTVGVRSSGDARSWLRANGHADVVELIDKVSAMWAKAGKRTRRNWWDILAGDRLGRGRRVGGVTFPVIATAQRRQGRVVSAGKSGEKKARPAGLGPEKVLPEAKPFIKWAGGKRQLLSAILSRLPNHYRRFHEPFVGGGAVFFALRPAAAVLYDQNERLIRAYLGVKNSVESVIALLRTYRNEKRFFLKMRSRSIDNSSDAEVAAWLIYLNKTGFNGIYRVNSKNLFNVPYAGNPRATICDEVNLYACSESLKSAELRCSDFAMVLETAGPGDVVYFDPPYVPVSATSYFTSYTSQGFSLKDQIRLRDVAIELRRRDVFVLLSNSNAPAVIELYKKWFDCIPVSAYRLVNSDPLGRGKVTELLIK
jgi:DNA adenine methylase